MNGRDPSIGRVQDSAYKSTRMDFAEGAGRVPAPGRWGLSSLSTRKLLYGVMLPSEHGATVALVEPILLGLALAFSLAGSLLATAGVMGFWSGLALRRGVRFGGREPFVIAAAFSLPSALLFLAGLLLGHQPAMVLVPLIAGGLLGLGFLGLGRRLGSRSLWVELTGALAPACLAAAIPLASGQGWELAGWAWGLMVFRQAGTIVYIRSRLRERPGSPSPKWPVHALHGGFLLVGLVGWRWGLPGVWVPVAVAILGTRAGLGLHVSRVLRTAKALGFSELAVGMLYLFLLWLGLR